MWNLLLTGFEYLLLFTVLVVALVMLLLAICWSRRAFSPLALLFVPLALFLAGFTVYEALSPHLLVVLVLVVLVFISSEFVIELSPALAKSSDPRDSAVRQEVQG